MIVTVIYRTGKVQTFLVPEEMLAAEFQSMAEQIGGKIRRLSYHG